MHTDTKHSGLSLAAIALTGVSFFTGGCAPQETNRTSRGLPTPAGWIDTEDRQWHTLNYEERQLEWRKQGVREEHAGNGFLTDEQVMAIITQEDEAIVAEQELQAKLEATEFHEKIAIEHHLRSQFYHFDLELMNFAPTRYQVEHNPNNRTIQVTVRPYDDYEKTGTSIQLMYDEQGVFYGSMSQDGGFAQPDRVFSSHTLYIAQSPELAAQIVHNVLCGETFRQMEGAIIIPAGADYYPNDTFAWPKLQAVLNQDLDSAEYDFQVYGGEAMNVTFLDPKGEISSVRIQYRGAIEEQSNEPQSEEDEPKVFPYLIVIDQEGYVRNYDSFNALTDQYYFAETAEEAARVIEAFRLDDTKAIEALAHNTPKKGRMPAELSSEDFEKLSED